MDDSRWIPRKIDFHCRVLFLFLLVYKEIAIIANTQGISISIKLFQFFFVSTLFVGHLLHSLSLTEFGQKKSRARSP